MTLQTGYELPAAAVRRLESLVSAIERNPGRMVDPVELAALQERVDMRPAFAALPETLSEDDFVGVLKLALLTECATDSYAAVIEDRASRYQAGWLGRFTRDTWVPDERMHHAPYRTMLERAGIAAEELDREIEETQTRTYIHHSGDTPIHITAFGMVQEYLTDHWHGRIAQLLRQSSPEAAAMANQIKRRETIHTIWYRDMTALQLEANPRLMRHVAEAVAHFRMPGSVLVPELEAQVPRWLPALGTDFDRLTSELIRHIHAVAGDTASAARLLLTIAEERGLKVGPLPAGLVSRALNRLGGPGYGLLGEAVLQRVGLGYLFEAEQRAGGPHSERARVGRVRTLLRNWLADQIDIELEPA